MEMKRPQVGGDTRLDIAKRNEQKERRETMKKLLRRLAFLFQVRKSIPFVISFFRSRQVPVLKKAFFLALIAGYFLLPTDVLPDFLPFLGIVDDLTLLGFILNQIVKQAPPELKERFGVKEG
ncbi:DUF1232 domain-containing protein [Bacillaceae bacterium]